MSTPVPSDTSYALFCVPCVLLCWQAQPGSRLVEESDFCSRCLNRGAGKDLLAAALQVVEFSDTEFFDEHLRLQFAETVAGQGGAPWPGSNSEVRVLFFITSTTAATYRGCAVQK